MIYLASPYSHRSVSVRRERHRAAVHAAIAIMAATGDAVFSPIAHSHYIHEWSGGKIGGDWEQWAAFDRTVIRACDAMYLLMIPGWERSSGIMQERAIALERGIPIVPYPWPPPPRPISRMR